MVEGGRKCIGYLAEAGLGEATKFCHEGPPLVGPRRQTRHEVVHGLPRHPTHPSAGARGSVGRRRVPLPAEAHLGPPRGFWTIVPRSAAYFQDEAARHSGGRMRTDADGNEPGGGSEVTRAALRLDVATNVGLGRLLHEPRPAHSAVTGRAR